LQLVLDGGETRVINFSIEALLPTFPDFVVGVVVAEAIAPPAHSGDILDELIDDERRRVAERLAGQELAEVQALKCWRQAYKAFGVRGTTYRSSVDRLVRSVLKNERPFPRISPLVDTYNVASLHHLVPIGADDLAVARPPLAFRFATEHDTFVPLGSATGAIECPEPGEVVYADSERVLCRRWNWYQCAGSAVSHGTTRAVLTVQGLGPNARSVVETATADLDRLLTQVCGSQQSQVVLDGARPNAHLSSP
jgi:DNA/RNA-binding domain of Phe-tRNA-synthetase-like protein